MERVDAKDDHVIVYLKEVREQQHSYDFMSSLIFEKWDKTGCNIEKNKNLYSDKWYYIFVSYMY